MRSENRTPDKLRTITVERPYGTAAAGSVVIHAGNTTVLCTASVDESVPPWKLKADPPTGWVTAEYNMLPGSTSPRKARERSGKVDGRSTEIQRLIGRSLRAAVNTVALGPRTITIDCDVLRADGGTRTASITGGFIALVDAIQSLRPLGVDPAKVLTNSIAAVSVGIVGGVPVLDLDYQEDNRAEVDMNVVMTGKGEFVEVQGSAERGTFTPAQLQALLGLGIEGVRQLSLLQQQVLGKDWPF
jgi:ribonuclease PH